MKSSKGQSNRLMLDILRSPLALKDAQNIWLYSYEQWGEEQANRYLHGLNAAIMSLAENPRLGRDIGEARAGYYRYQYQRHLVVYRFSQTSLEIMRILHQRMDISRHTVQ